MRTLLALLLLTVPLAAHADPRIIPAERIREVHVVAKGGELSVNAVTNRVVEVDLSDPDAKVEELDGVLWVRFAKGYSELRIPLRATLTVEAEKLSPEIAGRYQRLEVRVATGDVTLTVESAETVVAVARGNVSSSGMSNRLRILVSHGDVELMGMADEARVEAPEGEVRVERPPRVLEVIGGTGLVTLDGRFESKSKASVQTTSGNVVVTAGGVDGIRAAISSESGAISVPDAAPQKSKATFVRGKGGTEIRVATVSGSVRVED
ncbi:MAG: DUF4097 family beta strand repeat protein [Deltaproteobacteria bacterium]|nr:DUF4097 family beta strand repeat protein [Deltaproteobacteria bacterium]